MLEYQIENRMRESIGTKWMKLTYRGLSRNDRVSL